MHSWETGVRSLCRCTQYENLITISYVPRLLLWKFTICPICAVGVAIDPVGAIVCRRAHAHGQFLKGYAELWQRYESLVFLGEVAGKDKAEDVEGIRSEMCESRKGPKH